MVKIACSGNEFISSDFLSPSNPYKPSNSPFHWLPIGVFRMMKISGVIKNLSGKELKKTPCIKCRSYSLEWQTK